MRLIDTTAERLLRIAATRWPAELCEEQSREWAGELYAIRHDDTGRWRRAWAQLRFSLSLATSPPVDDPDKIPNGWRETMPRLGLTLRRCLMLMGVGLLCIIVVQILVFSSGAWTELASDPTTVPREYKKATMFLGLIASIAGVAWLGHRLGRGMPLQVRHRRRFGALASATLVVTSLFASLMVFWFRHGIESFGQIAGPLAGFVVLLSAAVVVSVLAVRGRVRHALWWGTGIVLVLLDLVSIPLGALSRYVGIHDPVYAPYAGADISYFDLPASLTWFLQSLVWTGVKPGTLAAELELHTISALVNIMPVLLTIGAFALTYLARSASTARVDVPVKARSIPTTVSVWRRRVGLAVTGVGVVTWAAVLAFTTTDGTRFGDVADQHTTLWATESRNWSIMLASLGLAWALSGRTRVLLPSIAFGLATLATDVIVDRAHFVGAGAFLVTAGIGGAMAVAAWWIPTKMDEHVPEAGTVRRTVVAIAVLAAYCAPTVLSQFPFRIEDGATGVSWQSIGLPVIATVLTVGFAAVAGAAACTGRRRSPSTAAAVAIIGVPIAILAALGIGARFEFPVPAIFTATALGIPMVVYMTAVMHWDRRERSGKDVLRWIAGGLGATAASVLLLYPQYGTTVMLGNALQDLRGAGHDPNGFPMFVGFLMGAVVYAIVVALITVRDPRREPAHRSAPDGEEGSVAAPA